MAYDKKEEREKLIKRHDCIYYLNVTEFPLMSIFAFVTSANEIVTNRESFLCAHLTGAVRAATNAAILF